MLLSAALEMNDVICVIYSASPSLHLGNVIAEYNLILFGLLGNTVRESVPLKNYFSLLLLAGVKAVFH